MQTQDPPIPLPNHKTFNMFTSTLIKNHIPSSISMFKLQTHHDLLLNSTLHRYVTNIILSSSRWLKIYAMFQHNQIHSIFQTQLNESIRSIHQIQKSILIEVEHKLICVSYEPGNFKTVGMVSLEFIRLRFGYESWVRVDNWKKYVVIVAGDYLVFVMGAKGKDMGMVGECGLFEKALDEVKWYHPEYNYFQSIVYLKVGKPWWRGIVDVQIDKGNVYFLARENSVPSIYVLAFDNIKPETTIDTLFTLKFTNLPPLCYKLTVLSPETLSSFLIFSSESIYHLAVWQQQPIGKYQLSKDTNLTTLKVRSFNPSHIYYQDNNGIHVLKILPSGQMQSTRVNSTIVSDFCMTTVSINGCLGYLSNGKCTVEIFEGNISIYSWVNSLLDFYVGKNLILGLEWQNPVWKGGKESNRVIAIKRNFKCVDKVLSHPKKTFVEGLLPAEVASIGATRYLVVKANGKKMLYRDAETITGVGLDNIVEVFEAKTMHENKEQNCLGVYFENGTISLHLLSTFDKIWTIENILGRVIDINNGLFCIENNGILTVVNLHNKHISTFQHPLPEETIKFQIAKQHISFIKRTFNSEQKFDTIPRYLLYVCTPSVLEIYTLRPQTNYMVLSWSTPKIGSGLAVLSNSLDRHKGHREFEEYRSISDPHYVISNLAPTQIDQNSKYTVVDFKYSQLPSQTIILFLTSSNEFYLYKRTIAQNPIGMLYQRVVLPLYESKIPDFTITQFTTELLKFGTRVLYDDVLLDIPEPVKQCFYLGGELWIMGNDNKLRLADIKGNRVSGKLVYTVADNNSYHGIDNTPEYYIFFTRDSIELYDKDLVYRSKIPLRSLGSGVGNQQMITAKASQSTCAISSCQHFKSVTEKFESYKFVFFVYDIKDKQRTDPLFFQQPVVSIKFGKPGRIAFATSSNFYVYEVKQNKLEVVKTVFFSMRPYLGGFAYWRDMKPSTANSYHFMVFGGSIDGLSFAGFDDEKLIFQEKWFEPLKFGTRDIEIFGYGTSFKAIIADNYKNVIVMDLNNQSTSKLYDFHLSTLVNKLTKVEDSNKSNELVYCCCADGTIRVFTAIKRQENISLRKFQKLILEQLPTFGGLPLDRKIKQEIRSYKVSCKGNIVESGTLELFNSLSQEIRESIIEKSQYEQQELQNTISKNCVF